jgi:Protein of unknown function (DUF1656)
MPFDVPAAVSLGFFFLPPVAVDAVLGVLSAFLIARLLNRTGLSRFFWHPPLALFGLAVLMSSLFGLFLPP